MRQRTGYQFITIDMNITKHTEAINQSEAAGAQVEAGTVISVQLSDSGVTD